MNPTQLIDNRSVLIIFRDCLKLLARLMRRSRMFLASSFSWQVAPVNLRHSIPSRTRRLKFEGYGIRFRPTCRGFRFVRSCRCWLSGWTRWRWFGRGRGRTAGTTSVRSMSPAGSYLLAAGNTFQTLGVWFRLLLETKSKGFRLTLVCRSRRDTRILPDISVPPLMRSTSKATRESPICKGANCVSPQCGLKTGSRC